MTLNVHQPRIPAIAFAHDWLVTPRGGEAVLESIIAAAATVGDPTRIFTMFDGGLPLNGIAGTLPRTASVVQSLPFALRLRRWLLPTFGLAVRDLACKLLASHTSSPIDLFISSSSAAVIGIEPPPGVPHLCYAHAPARYLWSCVDDYARNSTVMRCALDFFGDKLREADRDYSRSVTEFIANSTHTAEIIRRAYGRDATVIHPPVRTDFFTPGSGNRDDFWLVAGALEPYKRVDLAIDAAQIAGKKLVIVGRGSCLPQLRSRAGRDVTFITDADDDMLRALYRRARVLLHPQVEDFGIVAVEAQACGLPVAAFARGGSLDTVQDAVTGTLFREQSAECLARAARETPDPDAPNIRSNALRFEPRHFHNRFREVIRRHLPT